MCAALTEDLHLVPSPRVKVANNCLYLQVEEIEHSPLPAVGTCMYVQTHTHEHTYAQTHMQLK